MIDSKIIKVCILLSAYFIFSVSISAQETINQENPASVEKSLFGVQTGLFGIWGFHEARLSNRIALRSELGLDAGFLFSKYHGNGFVLTPVISVEPRWYYNIQKREGK